VNVSALVRSLQFGEFRSKPISRSNRDLAAILDLVLKYTFVFCTLAHAVDDMLPDLCFNGRRAPLCHERLCSHMWALEHPPHPPLAHHLPLRLHPLFKMA
jgi:hypothetical protein